MPVAPPRPKGPHLNALRAFESAARLGSFTAAADELGVTPGAVAQHIKSLEAWTNSDLFERRSRGVELTPLGATLLPQFTAAFDALGQAVQSLRAQSAPNSIRIATLPSLAQLWLSERLGRLRELAPDISVSVVALETPPNLTREPFDVALFFKSGPFEHFEKPLFQDRIFPVCAPSLARRLNSVSDLDGETLIHDSTWTGDWSEWLKQVPEVDRSGQRGPTHSLFSVALEEAKHGAGILMAHEALVQAALISGELVAPFPQRVQLDQHLVLSIAHGFERTRSCSLLLQALLPAS
ncbi:Glycine cleavage system transcriptional activator [Falsiruegeria litorea R37]|uniref:Glycine cleavage system transcriptional activator n=1 Tax=Falsiruegeria litorea R37 TaxID=1200284 RepID=A0A1Y5RQD3_9RHOB|nr:LysR substrate-binding domain-containing protein [Falsiruegeria litorea]SLN20192.1 Glycine cleavage system transcriptional activator [Falsiruegeria litorea R37]